MTSPPKRDFTFAFFDAARTDGYVASKRIESDTEENGFMAEGGMFSNENEGENIVDKIRHVKVNEHDRPAQSTKRSFFAREMLPGSTGELFLDMNDKEAANEVVTLYSQFRTETQISKSLSDAQADSTESIQLNRLLDDYMLSTKGDRIMKQMEELISDEAADPAKFSVPAHTSTDQFADEELESSLFALSSMSDFEKYISEN